MSTVSEAASEATRARNHARMVARVEELVWLIEVYGYSPAEAQRQLRLSDRTFREYREYIAAHPELTADVTAGYGTCAPASA